ncbi:MULTISPECIES: hypothetical protein [Microbacterium]|uniref:Uncharacterized protein n=1 Tax=Microbacterium wangchenii TaxID=2541726 RepID=A0ABX5SSI9_9MICO|nr:MULTISPECIES: hypothetical protein [Microbacterium]MCK6065725.1 hypothetical protein [Microbacterium sp. EYE_512]QBR89130.1 hypothetical protein E4K62_10805 [Microbacterium wangchenii]TXK08991.1 hypothetical protein FVP99_18500 [Microbacterium wangchenii]
MIHIRPIALVAVVGLILPLTACASAAGSSPSLKATSSPTAAPSAEVELPSQDRSRWVMPLDEFQDPSTDALLSYAENLLVADCLGEEGISWPIPWQPTDDESYLEPEANISGFPALTVALATESGYHVNFNPGWRGISYESTHELNAIALSTPGFEPVFSACLDQARQQMPTLAVSESTNQLLAWRAETDFLAEDPPAVVDAGARWQRCLKDAGYVSVPDSPYEKDEADSWMPSDEMMAEAGIPPREAELTQQEIDLAVADASCRESSGWSEAYYQKVWEAQAELVSEHADELIRIREEWEAAREIVLDVVAAHAPAQ